MLDTPFEITFFAGMIAADAIRIPHRFALSRDRILQKISDSRLGAGEIVLMTVAFLGMWAAPLLYMFSPLLDGFDYDMPQFGQILGAVFLAASLLILWLAHRALGRNWSPTLEIRQGHTLVTTGVYARVRHPMYAAMWLSVAAQPLLLPNWVAGFSGLVSFTAIFTFRLPREERMMLDTFGDAYRDYIRCTGTLLPKIGWIK